MPSPVAPDWGGPTPSEITWPAQSNEGQSQVMSGRPTRPVPGAPSSMTTWQSHQEAQTLYLSTNLTPGQVLGNPEEWALRKPEDQDPVTGQFAYPICMPPQLAGAVAHMQLESRVSIGSYHLLNFSQQSVAVLRRHFYQSTHSLVLLYLSD